MELNDTHRKYLNDHAVSDQTIADHGVTSEGDEILFPWFDAEGGTTTIQRRPWPGDSGVYYWEKGKDLHFWGLRDAGADAPILLVEGTKQSLAAASWAPSEFSVLGMAGCEGWNKCDLSRFEGRTVYLCLDADAGSNLSVYEAGELFGQQASFYDAEVKYLHLPGRGSQGLDDVLAKFPETKRPDMISRLVKAAHDRPAVKKPTARKGPRLGTELPDTGDRPGVAVNLDRKEVIDKITTAFKDKWDGTVLFNYGDLLTRVRGHETRALDKDSFYAMLVDTVACYNYTAATDKRPASFDPRWPDQQSMDAVRSKADEFSPLHRVVRIPFLRPDGSVCSTPGYDRETATMLVSSGIDDVVAPESPTQEETRSAAKFLMTEWLGDLPFKTDADRANALAFVLTPFIRGSVPLAPLAVVSGLQMGVGKNLFADCVNILATGEAAEPLPYVASEEEMRKQITASFSGGRELFVFDEAHTVEGAQLARAVTSVNYTDRVLGVSRMAKFPNRVTWAALGNKVQVNGDMSRRVYFIYLHPSGRDVMDRQESEFRHPDLKLWTAENRSALVAAALTVLRGWYAVGRPRFSRGTSMGSFEPWDRLMSGALAYAGFPAFLTDMKDRRSESDFTSSYWHAHVHWLHEQFGDAEFTTAQVRELAQRDPQGFEAPPGMEDTSGRDYTRKLGMAYARHQDRNHDGVRLVKSGMGHKSTIKWRTEADDGGKEVKGGEATTHPVAGTVICDDVTTRVTRKAGGSGHASTSLPASEPVDVSMLERVRDGLITMDVSDPWEEPTPVTADQAFPPIAEDHFRDTTEVTELGFDIETHSARKLWSMKPDPSYVKLCGTVDSKGGYIPGVPLPDFTHLLNDAETVYGHNILGFDLLALARHCGADYDALAAKAVDTLVLARLADPPMARDTGSDGKYNLDTVAKGLGHTGKSGDLKALAIEYGKAAGFTGKEAETEGYGLIDNDDPRYVDYLRGDLAATQHVYDTLDGNLTDYAKREMKVVALQNRMTLNGWRVDTEELARRVDTEDARRAHAVKELSEKYGLPTHKPDRYRIKLKKDWPQQWTMADVRALDGETQAREGFATVVPGEKHAAPWATDAGRAALIEAFRAAGAEFYPTTPSGQLALSSDALGEGDWYDKAAQEAKPGMLKVYGHLPAVREIVGLLNEATGATAKYAEIQTHTTPEGRVHAEVGAAQGSGRWATLRPASSNLGKRGEKVEQRAVFLPDPGHVLLACDLSQVDMRGIAGLCQDPAYMALFEPGRDAHSEMAAIYFGEASKANREKTKAINHGSNYGQSAKAISEINGLDLSMVESTLAARAEAFPRLVEWTQEVRDLAASGALLDNGFGRLMRPDPARAWTQGPALMGQGAARDLMCEGLLRLVEARPEVTPYLRGVVHDEVILSVPEDEVNGWAGSLVRAFTFEWRGVPILCEVSKPGLNWADCYAGE